MMSELFHPKGNVEPGHPALDASMGEG